MAVPDLVGDQDVAGAVMSQSPSLAVIDRASLPWCRRSARNSHFAALSFPGSKHQHRTRSAILLSALMFGFLHVLLSLFQQLFNATLLGIVLGLLAVRSRSILPGIVFHFLNNALAVSHGIPGARAVGSAHRPLDLSQSR